MRIAMTMVAAMLLAAGGARAQSSIMLEACNALPDPVKRLDCLKEAVRTAPTAPTELAHAKIRDIFVGLQGALDGGISYNQYQGLLLDVTRELALFKAKPQSSSEAVQLLNEAADAYIEAGQFWAASIRYSSRIRRGLLVASDVLPEIDLQIAGLVHIARKYSIPLAKADAFGLGVGLQRGTALSTMWAFAKEQTSKAFTLMDAPPPPKEPKKDTV